MLVTEIEVREHREAEHEIDPIFIERWSPRSMSGQELTEQEIGALFEAARWAPSSYNGQPWRLLYARRGTEHWDAFFDLMVEFNQGWAKNAGLLIVILSRRTFERNGKPSPTHSFDSGAAWQNLALQGGRMGLVVHGMQGFDYDKARETLEVPDDFAVEAMAAVGRPGRVEDLPEKLRQRELPSGRKTVDEISIEGRFRD